MLKKRVIFTLLYDQGNFMLSRNFRLQKVGNINWLLENYRFKVLSKYIDELVVLDVSRGDRNLEDFSSILRVLAADCFMPISAGGGIRTITEANILLRSGADKIVLNTALFSSPSVLEAFAKEFGRQCIVGSIDIRRGFNGNYKIYTQSGVCEINGAPTNILSAEHYSLLGECYLNSIDRDGTGQGFDFEMLDQLPKSLTCPIILAGGVGKSLHLFEGLSDSRVSAVATANLFNFVGNGLQIARADLLNLGINIAKW